MTPRGLGSFPQSLFLRIKFFKSELNKGELRLVEMDLEGILRSTALKNKLFHELQASSILDTRSIQFHGIFAKSSLKPLQLVFL